MDYALIVFNSVSASNRAKRIAKKAVSYAAVVQLPSDLGIRGCSYALRIKRSDYDTIKSLMGEYGLEIKSEFLEKNTDSGKIYEQYDIS